jgi:hypothetical protein
MAESTEWRFSHLGTGSEAISRSEPGHVYVKPITGGPMRRLSTEELSQDELRRLTELSTDQPLPEDLARVLFRQDTDRGTDRGQSRS